MDRIAHASESAISWPGYILQKVNPQRMYIRQANPSDARRISYLIQKNTERVYENQYSPVQIQVWKKANTPQAIKQQLAKRIIFCAFQGNQLVGTIGLQENELVGLYVSYAKRKLGLGRKLLDHLENFAEARNISTLTLTSTISAKRFYYLNGYKPI